MFDRKAFELLIEKRGVKITALAAAMKMGTSTFYRKLSGESEFTRSEIQLCCEFFGVDHLNHIFFAKEVS